MTTSWWTAPRFEYRPNVTVAALGEVLLGLGDPDTADQAGIALTPKFRGSGFHSVTEYVLRAQESVVAHWRACMSEGWRRTTVVLEDLSLDTCVALHFFAARLELGISLPPDQLEAWCHYVTRWEQGYTLEDRPAEQSIAQLVTTLGHSHFSPIHRDGDVAVDTDEFQSGAMATLSLLADALALGQSPATLSIDRLPPSEPLYRAQTHLAYEYARYLEALQVGRQCQLSVPMQGSNRKRLVNALFVTEETPSALLKVFARNDRKSSWRGLGFEVLGVYRPLMSGTGSCMTVSVAKESGLSLRALWQELERLEDIAWGTDRPKDQPRALVSYSGRSHAPNEPWWDDSGNYTLIGAPKFVAIDGVKTHGTKLNWHKDVLPAIWTCYSPIPNGLNVNTEKSVHGEGLAYFVWSHFGPSEWLLPGVAQCPTFSAWLAAASSPLTTIDSPNALPLPIQYRVVNIIGGFAVVHREGISVMAMQATTVPCLDKLKTVFKVLTAASNDLQIFHNALVLNKALEYQKTLLDQPRHFNPHKYLHLQRDSWRLRKALLKSGADALGHADAWPLNEINAAYAEMLGLGRRRSETLATLEQIDTVIAATAESLLEQRQRKWRAIGAALGLAFVAKETVELVQLFFVPNIFTWQLAILMDEATIPWLDQQALKLEHWHYGTITAAAVGVVLGFLLSWFWDAKLESK